MMTPDAAVTSHPFLISAVQFERDLNAGNLSVADLAHLAVKHGASGVEYRDVHWRQREEEIAFLSGQLQSARLQAVYAVLTPLYHPDPAQPQQLFRDIDDAATLGAKLLRVPLGTSPAADAEGDALRESARLAVAQAAQRGIRIAVENNSRAPGEKISAIRAALMDIRSSALGTNLDFANYATTGQDPLIAIRALGPRIIYVHAKDARRTERGLQSTFLGGGTLPLREIFAALAKTGREFQLCFEFPGGMDPEEDIEKSKGFLATL
jgi:sugar phosphate isomerase/epimerase